MCIFLELSRNQSLQSSFNGKRRLASGQSSPVGHTKNMSVDRNGGLTESGIQHHVGCLSADSGQLFESASLSRHLTRMMLNQ